MDATDAVLRVVEKSQLQDSDLQVLEANANVLAMQRKMWEQRGSPSGRMDEVHSLWVQTLADWDRVLSGLVLFIELPADSSTDSMVDVAVGDWQNGWAEYRQFEAAFDAAKAQLDQL